MQRNVLRYVIAKAQHVGGELIVTWQGDGATRPAIGLGRELPARGHRVRVLAPARCAERIAATRCEHAAFPANAESGTDHARRRRTSRLS